MTLHLTIGYASRPFHDIPPCGDGWLSLSEGATTRLMFADGIGHGPGAHRIVTLLGEQLTWLCRRSNQLPGLETCLLELHRGLQRHAAGDVAQAAVALVDIDREHGSLAVAIVGNVQVHYHGNLGHHRFPSQNGMVGGTFPRHLRVAHAPLRPSGLLTLFSDGLESRAADRHLSDLQARGTRHGLCIQQEAERLLSHCGKTGDDASCALLWIEAAR